jgi:ATP-dependent DNA helicase RecQ
VLSYFGEEKGPCGACDLCQGGAKLVDETVAAQKLLSAVYRTGQRFGAHHLTDVVIGNASEAITRNRHNELPTFGVGKDRPKAWWLAFTRKVFAAGLLEETDGDRPGLMLTEQGADVLRGKAPLMVREDAEPAAARSGRLRKRDARALEDLGMDDQDQRLFEALKQLRRRLAAEEGVAAFMIFSDRSLIDMVRLKPSTRDDFSLVNGVGERKLEAYAGEFLAAIDEALR